MKKLLLLLLILSAFASYAQVPAYVPTDGLVGYWPFNGNANDESGNGNNGTVTGATLTTDRFGNANTAYSFNGVNNKINFGNAISLIGNVNFSYSFWMQRSVDCPNNAIVISNYGGNYFGNIFLLKFLHHLK